MVLNFPAVSVGLVGHVLISGWLVPNQWLLHGVVGYLTSGVLFNASSVASAVASLVAEIFAPDGVGDSDPSELLRPFGDLEFIISKREQLYYMFSTLSQG